MATNKNKEKDKSANGSLIIWFNRGSNFIEACILYAQRYVKNAKFQARWVAAKYTAWDAYFAARATATPTPRQHFFRRFGLVLGLTVVYLFILFLMIFVSFSSKASAKPTPP